MPPKPRRKYFGKGVALGMAIGAVSGTLYGITVDGINFWMTVGVGIGITIGAVVGSSLDAKKKTKD